MKVLWITNIMLPPICEKLNIVPPVVGGWVFSSAQSLLAQSQDLDLAIATVYNGENYQRYTINNITYYLLPQIGSMAEYQPKLEYYWKQVNEDFRPDIVHLHGTEYAHGLAFLKACPKIKSVVSIQGLTSVYARYFLGGITLKEIIKNISFYDLFKGSLLKGQKSFYRRGEYEKEILCITKHIIGRTSWDKAHSWAINPNATYHFCNETLRKSFYEHTWTYDQCEPHSIFISQSSYPIKGLQQLLKAMPLVLKYYPDTKIYISGVNILNFRNLRECLKANCYIFFIKRLISKNKLGNNIYFTGFLDEKQMCNRYLHSNIFICPSSIENSPNSLCEAQMLGVPCLASYVGGSPDLMKGAEENLYRFEEIEMLAYKICDIFSLGPNVYCENLQKQAIVRHNRIDNANRLLSIYESIISNIL